MDGNGRWATRRGLPRPAGHRAGAHAVRRVVEAAPEHGVAILTLYAFSADNWRRPRSEVAALMALLREYLDADRDRLIECGVRLRVIGRRDRLPDDLAATIAAVERASAGGQRLLLRLAIDYSARAAIVDAAGRARAEAADIAHCLADSDGAPVGDVDLLIRSGGERRLSDFLLWELAYAELLFSDTLWPDFGAAELAAALADFRRRDRRFGGLGARAAAE